MESKIVTKTSPFGKSQTTQFRGLRQPAICLFCFLRCLIADPFRAQTVEVKFRTLPREVIAQRIQRLPTKNAERETELKTMFAEAGCSTDQIQQEQVKRKIPPNISCTLPGATDSLIIVGAHSDHADVGTGAVDDWSGASLLPSLYQSLKDTRCKHTFVFIGFTGEEKRLAGSTYYVKRLPKERRSTIKAMVNLECLGLGPTEVWAHVADKELLVALLRVTTSMHTGLKSVNVDKVGDDDTQPFRDKKIPTITIHSVTQKTWRILHSPEDSLAAVRLDDLYESYRVITEYLAFIDQVLQ
jgi:hypothetical protein